MDKNYIKRLFLPPTVESFFIFGPRGTGKSTWLKKKYPDALWIDLNIFAFEVKNTNTIRNKDLFSLKTFHSDYPECRCFLLYRGKDKLLIDSINCIPCESFLLQLQPGKELHEIQ